MKKVLFGMLVAVGFLALVGWNTLPNDDTSIPGPAYFGKQVYIVDGSLYLGGTQVTANAANLNAGVASSTASLVSNATLKVYGSNLVIVTGGTVSVPAGSIGSAALAFATPYTTQTVAGVFTNVYDAKGLNVSHNP